MSDLAVYAILPVWVALCLVVASALGQIHEPPLAAWLRLWHGEGQAHQHQFYRCHGCQRLVTHAVIRSGGCECRMRGCGKISPTALRFREKAGLLCAPWLYSPWPKVV